MSASTDRDCGGSDAKARASYDVRGGTYWVPIEGQWMQVPERAVIRDQGNPIGEAVVWYVHHRGAIIIRLLRAGGRGLDCIKMTPVPRDDSFRAKSKGAALVRSCP